MADPVAAPEIPEVPAEIRLKRFLHMGVEIPKYSPGDWTAHNYFVPEKAKAIQDYINNSENCLEVVDIVKKVYECGSYTRMEPLVFTLVMCLRNGSNQLREAVYKIVPKICKQPEHLFLFVKYCKQLETGTGSGWRRCIERWYNERTPLQLAREISLNHGTYSFTHNGLIKMAHLKPAENDIARQCVYHYALHGYKKVRKQFASKPEATEVLNVFKNVSELRLCEEPKKAADMIKQGGFKLAHVPGHLLCDKMVWEALIPNLTTVELLHNVQRIHNMGFLDINGSTVPILKNALLASKGSTPPPVAANTSKQTATTNHSENNSSAPSLHPVLVYITMRNYEKMGRPMAFAKQKIESQKENKRISRELIAKLSDLTVKQRKIAENQAKLRNSGKSHIPNPVITESLLHLLKETWRLPVATGARYLITLDMRETMFKGRQHCERKPRKKNPDPPAAVTTEVVTKTSNKSLHPFNECFYERHVSAGHAAIILALQMLHRERDVTVAVFTEKGIQCVTLANKDNSLVDMQQAETKLRSAKVGHVRLDKPIEWAAFKNKRIDVFINIVDRISRSIAELPKEIRPGVKRKLSVVLPKENEVKPPKQKKGGGHSSQQTQPQSQVTEGVVDPIKVLKKYREKFNLPNTKLITVSLTRRNGSTTDGTHPGILDIVGLDEHTPKVIDAFSRNHFN